MVHCLIPSLMFTLRIKALYRQRLRRWVAVLLHEITAELFPVWLVSTFLFSYDSQWNIFSPITCPLTKSTLAPSPSTFKGYSKVYRALSCCYQYYLEAKSAAMRQYCLCLFIGFLAVAFLQSGVLANSKSN